MAETASRESSLKKVAKFRTVKSKMADRRILVEDSKEVVGVEIERRVRNARTAAKLSTPKGLYEHRYKELKSRLVDLAEGAVGERLFKTFAAVCLEQAASTFQMTPPQKAQANKNLEVPDDADYAQLVFVRALKKSIPDMLWMLVGGLDPSGLEE